MQKETFDVFCPTCNILVEAKVIARGFGEYRSDAVNPMDEVDSEYHGDHYSVALCRRCNGPFLVREALYGVPGEFETVTDEVVLYPVSGGPRIDGLPESIGRSVAQAHRSYAASSYDACALMCRRALEALCKTLSAKGRDLDRRLADLEASGRIDSRMIHWAHGVRLVGNEAAHDVDTAVTVEDARDILEFTEALLLYVFTLDTKFRSFEARRKGRAQPSATGVAQPNAAPNGGPATPSGSSGVTEGPPSVS
ncbi:MAG: DUF4145 domain-containing protein [Acidobacteria bacterium]|nr:DUF4145 domain-containing protein [Acidobacteriota bacterium]MBI3657133.1 DUF4145 domain-containing protein [Acidobacteriota bacterium]